MDGSSQNSHHKNCNHHLTCQLPFFRFSKSNESFEAGLAQLGFCCSRCTCGSSGSVDLAGGGTASERPPKYKIRPGGGTIIGDRLKGKPVGVQPPEVHAETHFLRLTSSRDVQIFTLTGECVAETLSGKRGAPSHVFRQKCGPVVDDNVHL